MGCATTPFPSQRESIRTRGASRTFVRKNKDPGLQMSGKSSGKSSGRRMKNYARECHDAEDKKAWRGHYVNIIICTCGVRRWVVPGLLKNDYPARRCVGYTRPNSDGRTFPVLVRWWRWREDALDQTDQEQKRKILWTQPHVSIVASSSGQQSSPVNGVKCENMLKSEINTWGCVFVWEGEAVQRQTRGPPVERPLA